MLISGCENGNAAIGWPVAMSAFLLAVGTEWQCLRKVCKWDVVPGEVTLLSLCKDCPLQFAAHPQAQLGNISTP